MSKFKHLPQLNLHDVILFVYTMNLYSKASKWLMCVSNSLPIYSTNSRSQQNDWYALKERFLFCPEIKYYLVLLIPHYLSKVGMVLLQDF